jgi:hypothetical protein
VWLRRVDDQEVRGGVLVAAGAVMLVFGVALDWASLGDISGNNAFDYFFTGGIAYLLVVAAGVVTFLLAGGVMKPGTTPWTIILLAATGLATLLMLLRLLLGAGDGGIEGLDLDRGPGMFVAFLAAAVALAGAVLNYTAAGGNLKDLTDIDKLKQAFNRPGGGAAPPPPPPAGRAAPPPPPPRRTAPPPPPPTA